ncbi:RNA polymerase sigma factor [bacterium]|nr:RNA polymerase sigma factor [bacterium]
MQPDDAELVSRSARGEGAAFAELMQRHGRPVVALLRRLLERPEDVEDLLQETLLHAWRDIGKLQEAGRVRAWLLQIARNRCRDCWKAQGRATVPLAAEHLEVAANRYGRAAGRADEQVEAAQEALRQVRPPLREAAELFYAEGWSIAEIARQLQCPAGTVKRRLHEARRHMRRTLGLDEEA